MEIIAYCSDTKRFYQRTMNSLKLFVVQPIKRKEQKQTGKTMREKQKKLQQKLKHKQSQYNLHILDNMGAF